jgi:hypothetical protein
MGSRQPTAGGHQVWRTAPSKGLDTAYRGCVRLGVEGRIMSHFYAEIQGNRGVASRGGSKKSGIRGHIRGWHVGARVICYFNEQTEQDEVEIIATAGSYNTGKTAVVASFSADDMRKFDSVTPAVFRIKK